METSQNNHRDEEINELINQLNNLNLNSTGQNQDIEEILNSDTNNQFKKKFLKNFIDAENERRLRIDAETREENEKKLRIDENMRRINAETREENEKMRRINAETREENEKCLRIEETGVGFLKLKGLPPLPKPDISISKPSYGNHTLELESVTHIKDNVIGIPSSCKISEMEDLPSLIWKQTVKDESQKCGRILTSWNGEVSIENFVFQVITDIITLLKLNSKIKVYTQVQITLVKHTPDLIFMEVNGRLIGICEVKKPSFDKSDLKDLNQNLQNQVTNYLLQLKNIYGVQTPIGIISTYNEWAICFLRESEAYMQSSEQFFTPPSESSAPSTDDGKMTLLTSLVYTHDSVTLIEVLAATIYKMYHSVTIPPVSLIRSSSNKITRKFGYVNNEGFVWKVLPSTLKSFSYEMPTDQTKNFYFIQDFHGGKDGRVWLSISEAGKLAVCKISKDHDYKNEALYWNTIWGPNLAYTTTLLNVNALIMPFVFHAHMVNGRIIFRPFGYKWSLGDCNIDDIRKSDIPGAFDHSLENYYNQPLLVAKEALTNMANAGYGHGDLEWRHVGLRPYKLSETEREDGVEWGVQPVLIDLHDSKPISLDEKEQVLVINEGLNKLKDTLKCQVLLSVST